MLCSANEFSLAFCFLPVSCSTWVVVCLVLAAGLEPLGIDVLTICPGYVDTPMTEELKGRIAMLTPQKAAATMVDAMVARSRGTIIVPGYDCLMAAIYNTLPTPFRALFCRVVVRFMPHEYIQRPG